MGGACSSCLGKRQQHASQDGDLDRMLGSDQISYGATDSFDYSHAQTDERELQRERDALEHITVHATDHMIDVLHPNESNLNHNLTQTTANGTNRINGSQTQHTEDTESEAQDAEEEAWLASIAGLDTAVQLPQKRALVLDVAQLRRTTPQQRHAAV